MALAALRREALNTRPDPGTDLQVARSVIVAGVLRCIPVLPRFLQLQ